MERYDTAVAADSFAQARSYFDELVGELGADAAGALSHDVLEEMVTERGRELQRQLLQDHLDLRARREEEAHAAEPVAVAGRSRTERGHERVLATLVGPVTVRRLAFRERGRPNVYPADDTLALPLGRHSLGLRRLAVLEAVRGSYGAAREALVRRCGEVAGKRQLEDLVRVAAVDVSSFYTGRTALPCTSSVLLVITADAKGIVMRPEALRPGTAKAAAAKRRGRGIFRTRLASGEKGCRKRMAALACVYDAVPAKRRPRDVIAVPGGRGGERAVRTGPRAAAKWLTASVAQDATQVIKAAFDQAEARDAGHRRCWVVLVDGDCHQIELIGAEAKRRKVTVHLIVDVIHVIEYLWKAVWCFHAKDDPAAEDWVATHALALLHGRSADVAAAVKEQAEKSELTADRRGGAEECVRYLENKEPYLRYDRALEAGWPIATGVVEGACRHLIADRFDVTGSRWSVAGAEALLALRAVIVNGDFEEYWRHHVEQEHRRTRQARHQDGYELTA